MAKLMVLDGNSILNRAFYGIRLLTASDGLYTNAIYGFLTILRKLLAEDRPDALCITFDVKEPTFRHRMYEGYKATRKGMPEELSMQLPWLRQVLDAMRIPCYAMAGWEADDLLGTIAAKCEAAGWDCLLVSGDRDSLQLITERTHVKLVSTKPGRSESTEYDTEAFQTQYGFPPARLVDLKALMGDSSDNIPGVPGVGEKTASALICRFGSLDAVYDNLENAEIKNAVRTKLTAGRESALLSYRLATISREAPLDFTPEENRLQPPDNDRLYEIFTRLEFSRLIESFGLTKPEAAVSAPAAETLPWKDCAPEALLELCRSAGRVFFHCDSTLSAMTVIAGDTGYTLMQPDTAFLRAFFSADIGKAGTELKALYRQLSQAGIAAEGLEFDAALAAYLLDPNDGSYSLQRCAKKLLSLELPEAAYEREGAFGLLEDHEEALSALRAHTQAIRSLYAYTMPLLEEQGMLQLYQTVELPLCRVLAHMEELGFAVDRAALAAFGESLGHGIDQLQSEIYALAGSEFNINSPRQLGKLLFEDLELPAYGKTKTGYSTNIEVLEKLRDKHPIVEKIMDYRKLSKLKSTYADGLLKYIDADGRIRTTFLS